MRDKGERDLSSLNILLGRNHRPGSEFESSETVHWSSFIYCYLSFAADADHLLFSNRSHAYNALDQYDKALEDAEKVVKMRPDWPKGFFRKGLALYGLGRYEEAVIAFLQCLALDKEVTSAKEYLSKVGILSFLSKGEEVGLFRCIVNTKKAVLLAECGVVYRLSPPTTGPLSSNLACMKKFTLFSPELQELV